jgi:dolichol-phosphate mannosyltransferase
MDTGWQNWMHLCRIVFLRLEKTKLKRSHNKMVSIDADIFHQVTVVIPAKNEAGGIVKVIKSVQEFVEEVIVVDGHSTDGTRDLATETGATVLLDNGRGKGAAYRSGVESATRDTVVFIDADGSHEPADIPKLVAPILAGEAELVIASRHRGGSDEWQGDFSTYLRSIGSGFISIVMNYRWGANLTDCLNGFRAIRRDVALRVPWKATDFDIEQHMIAQCLKYGYRVAEVASHEYVRGWGHSKLPTFKKAYLFFWRLFLDLVSVR